MRVITLYKDENAMSTQDFIFEICVEEIPARLIPTFEKEMELRCLDILAREMLHYTSYTLIATPRRIGIYIHELADTQGSKKEEVLGPPAQVAWNGEEPTPALHGFLKKYNISIDDVYVKETPKGQYIATQHVLGGKKTEDILSDICHELLLHLSSIQKMRWGSSHVVFARPLTALVALYGDIPIHVAYGPCVTASPQYTYGHRILCNTPLYIPSASQYFSILREQGMVVPLYSERKKLIEEGMKALEEKYNATIISHEDLLEENANLCEYPYVLLGDVDTRYLALPKEVFLTTIQSHQRSFGLVDNEGNLLPYFITITNNPHNSPNIKAGWERVLKARLEDAMFFYEIDVKTTFETWLEELDDVTFITSLGTMRERALRIQALAVYIAHLMAPHLETEASQAGLLCKADLVSAVVKEFDTLQGIMGGVYAREKGKGEDIANAIAEHYLPIGSSSLPSSLLGNIVALADKIDIVIGCFAMQMIPTGTTDTQGIRRAVLGIIRIILEYDIRIDFRDIFLYAKRLYGARDWKLRDEETLQALATFFSVRVKHYFLSLGFDTICIDAVLSIEDSLPSLAKRIKALQTFITTPHAKEVSMVFKRVSNIVEKERVHNDVTEKDCNTSLFQCDAEYVLYDAISNILPMLRSQIQEERYTDALQEIQKLYVPLQEFFENVLVLDKELVVRNNRITMLNAILCVLERIADFKELQL